MSRYTGPRVKVMRALGVDLPGLSQKQVERRAGPPGQHGHARVRKISEYGRRLLEKKKLCTNYGVTEGMLRRYMFLAKTDLGPTGEALLGLLELQSALGSGTGPAGFTLRFVPHRSAIGGRILLAEDLVIEPNTL